MKYRSTRGGDANSSFTEAVLRGMPQDGGLFIPQIDTSSGSDSPLGVSHAEFFSWRSLPYTDLAYRVLRLFIDRTEISDDELLAICRRSYEVGDSLDRWRTMQITPTKMLPHSVPVGGTAWNVNGKPHIVDVRVLELFHGPTFAFKDCALQLLGNLFQNLLKKQNIFSATVLGATSGDTGSAAVAGVTGRQGVNAVILYPEGRVSRVQELQMLSFNTGESGGAEQDEPESKNKSGSADWKVVEKDSGHNVNVVQSCSVRNTTFDDCQAIVKSVFADKEFVKKNNVLAVNSINIARVLAQMVYYLYSGFRVMEEHSSNAEKALALFSVPTGNFGDVLAGYWCRKFFPWLGRNNVSPSASLLQFEFVIGSNSNDILTRFFKTGSYEVLGCKQTLSPSMDIEISSNFERFLFDVMAESLSAETKPESVHAAASRRLVELFATFKEEKRFNVTDKELAVARKYFFAFSVSEEECVSTIKDVYTRSKNSVKKVDGCLSGEPYILCPHTAVGYKALLKTVSSPSLAKLASAAGTNQASRVVPIALATAHYGKFISSLLDFFSSKPDGTLDVVESELVEAMKTYLPEPLKNLERAETRLVAKRRHLEKDAKLIREYVELVGRISSGLASSAANNSRIDLTGLTKASASFEPSARSSKNESVDSNSKDDEATQNLTSSGPPVLAQLQAGSRTSTFTEARSRNETPRMCISWQPQREQAVTVRVPATTANLGPGFDCTGMALDVWNEVTISRAAEFSMTMEGEGAEKIPSAEKENLVCLGVHRAYKMMGKPIPKLAYHCKMRIPFCAGLGSSSAAVVSGIMAALALEDFQLAVLTEELLQLACDLEGHPDNVAPCIYGGFQLGYRVKERWLTSRVTVPPGMVCVVLVPDHNTETSAARNVLPAGVSRSDAIFNMSRVGLLINAFNTSDFGALRAATQDALHQKARGESIHKHLTPVIEAALQAGAHGAFLSGAGPSVCALCSGMRGDLFTQTSDMRNEQAVAVQMLRAADNVFGPESRSRILITKPVEYGSHIVAELSGLGVRSAMADHERITYV